MIKQDITLKITDEKIITELTRRANSTLPHCDFDHNDYPYVFNRSQALNRDLDRYYSILKNTFKEVICTFSFDEILSLLQVMHGTIYKANSNSLFYQDDILFRIEDAIQHEELEKNLGQSLLLKIKKLIHLEVLAIVDYIEYFMNHIECHSIEQSINEYLA